MDGLGLLRALVAHRDQTVQGPGMRADALRFIIEFPGAIDLDGTTERIAELLGADSGFEFFPLFENDEPDAEFGVFYVLQFPGLDRTAGDSDLFSISHDLRDRLDAATVEPDIGSTIYQEPQPPGTVTEGSVGDLFGDLFGSLCFVDTPPPSDHQWALRTLRVLGSQGSEGAWAISGARGAGVRIGQPDTGVTLHVELDAVGATSGRDVLAQSNDATDPLNESGNPGHGTGTASVAVSGPGGAVRGPAPKATLVPIRCIESVVLSFNAGPVAQAIDWARRHNCHVITMSLGGTPSWAVKKACRQATRDGVIVLAAAGNCVRTVVYPARYDDVIAVAGSTEHDDVWRGSSRGPDVDVTAPGENVWKAVAGPTREAIGGGQGTSFAVALTAAVAALWLSHHGRQEVLAQASSRGTTVQELFRQALKASARPAGSGEWDTDNLGAGIVDAKALLERPLEAADGPALETAPGGAVLPGADIAGLIAETMGADEAVRIVPALTRQFELEVAALALKEAANRRLASRTAERVSTRPPLSPQLRSRLEPTQSSLLRTGRSVAPPTPVVRSSARLGGPDAVLVAASHSPLEAAGRASVEAARAELRDHPEARLEALEARLDRIEARVSPGDRVRLARLRPRLLTDAERVVDMLGRGEVPPPGPQTTTALEALVALEGRPAVPLGDDGVVDESDLGEWAGSVLLLHPDLAVRQRSVGRIDSDGGVHQGTGFVVGPGLVMTNRHVAQQIAIPLPRVTAPAAWVIPGAPSINFSPEADAPDRAFRIVEVVYAGTDPIGQRIDLADLDLALLRVEEKNAQGTALPGAIPLSFDPLKTKDAARLFVIGYPAAPTVLPTDDAGHVRRDVVDVLRLIYGVDYGRRYLSPGLVKDSAATLGDSPNRWTLTHDATTLGGNSGSCVLAADGSADVVGLHFAGDWLRANYAHDLGVLHDVVGSWL